MKFDLDGLFQAAGIRCTYLEKAPDGTILRHEAVGAFVTEISLMAMEAAARFDMPAGRQISAPFGSFVAVLTDTRGRRFGRRLMPGEYDSFVIDVGGAELPFTGEHMFVVREILKDQHDRNGGLTFSQANLLGGIQEIFETVCQTYDRSRFPPDLIAQAFRSALTDAFGHFDLPVSPEEFARKAHADLVRSRIGLLDPGHEDGMTSAPEFMSLLHAAGITPSRIGAGAGHRAPMGIDAEVEEVRRAISADDRMVREVFGAMTRCSVEELSVATIAQGDVERLCGAYSHARLTGPWIEEVQRRVVDVTTSGMGSTPFGIAIYAIDGCDVAVFTDVVAPAKDIAFAFSWPSHMRTPIVDVGQGHVISITPEDVPNEVELERLIDVLDRIEARISAADDHRAVDPRQN